MLALPDGRLLVEILEAFTASASSVGATPTSPLSLALTLATTIFRHARPVVSNKVTQNTVSVEDDASFLALKPKTLWCTSQFEVLTRTNLCGIATQDLGAIQKWHSRDTTATTYLEQTP